MVRPADTSDLVRSYKMSKIKYVTQTDEVTGVIIETVLMDRGNGEFTSMLKSAYDEQQAAALNVTNEL